MDSITAAFQGGADDLIDVQVGLGGVPGQEDRLASEGDVQALLIFGGIDGDGVEPGVDGGAKDSYSNLAAVRHQ